MAGSDRRRTVPASSVNDEHEASASSAEALDANASLWYMVLLRFRAGCASGGDASAYGGPPSAARQSGKPMMEHPKQPAGPRRRA
jgi:hypothetical protein